MGPQVSVVQSWQSRPTSYIWRKAWICIWQRCMWTRCSDVHPWYVVQFPISSFVLLRHTYSLRDLLDDRKSESSCKRYETSRATNACNPGINMLHVRFWKSVVVKWSLTNDDYLCWQDVLRYKVSIIECIGPYDPDENYSAGWWTRAQVAQFWH